MNRQFIYLIQLSNEFAVCKLGLTLIPHRVSLGLRFNPSTQIIQCCSIFNEKWQAIYRENINVTTQSIMYK